MKIQVNKKAVTRIGATVLIIILFFSALAIKDKSMENKFALTLSSVNAENENLKNKISSLEDELNKAREENGIMAEQLRCAKEDLADAGRSLKDNDDKLLIEAYNMYKKGKIEEAQKKVQVLDTTYLTELQLYVYEQIMVQK